MSIIRSTLVADARLWADATGSTRWDDTFILRLLDVAFRREWSGILNANRLYRTGIRTPVGTYNGTLNRMTVDLSLLGGGAGDTTEAFYRVISLQADNRIFSYELIDRIPGALVTGNSFMQPSFWISGTTITLSPATASTAPTVFVNHIPQRPSLLVGDTSTVVFPDGYDEILALMTAALMLGKGGAETGANTDLTALASTIRDDMLADVSRYTTEPQALRHSDSAREWGA